MVTEVARVMINNGWATVQIYMIGDEYAFYYG